MRLEDLRASLVKNDALIAGQERALGQACYAQWRRRREAERQEAEIAHWPLPIAHLLLEEPAPSRKTARPGRRSPAGAALERAVGGLGAEFTNKEAAAASGLRDKRLANLLSTRQRKGWLQKIGYGRWRKTARWPKPQAGEVFLEQIHNEIQAKQPKTE